MQKKKNWKSKIKLNNVLRLAYRNAIAESTEDREMAEWFIEERRRFLSAITKKKEKTKLYFESLTSTLSEHNKYVSEQRHKYLDLERQCKEVLGQINKLSTFLQAA